jgi:transcriptional regulator with XRE-family HTH domain
MRRHAEQRKIQKNVGSIIEARRVAVGLSVSALADAAGVDLSHMVKILRGKSGVSLYSLRRISTALEWTPGELVTAVFPSRASAR